MEINDFYKSLKQFRHIILFNENKYHIKPLNNWHQFPNKDNENRLIYFFTDFKLLEFR